MIVLSQHLYDRRDVVITGFVFIAIADFATAPYSGAHGYSLARTLGVARARQEK